LLALPTKEFMTALLVEVPPTQVHRSLGKEKELNLCHYLQSKDLFSNLLRPP
jgi:hypothetical protein